jgi:hypothetical protein
MYVQRGTGTWLCERERSPQDDGWIETPLCLCVSQHADNPNVGEPVAKYAEVGEWWQHVKTGGMYEVVALGNMESDKTAVVVYRGKSGFVWVRPSTEFNDGRFTRVVSRPALESK